MRQADTETLPRRTTWPPKTAKSQEDIQRREKKMMEETLRQRLSGSA
jgi:hypothetical protein